MRGRGLCGLMRVVTAARERGVTAGGQAEAGLEMPSHVALVGKAYSVGGVGKRGAARDLGPHALKATADEVAVRRGAEPVAEATGEGIAVEAGLFLQHRGGDGASGVVEEGAQSAPPPKPSGGINIHQVQVAFIGSGAVGGGTLHFRGRSYPFKLGGLGIGGIGVSTLDATGTVYNLRRLQDFEGVYGQAQVGWAVGEQGKGEMWLQNGNGVYLRLKARCEGLALSLGADGMVVRLGG